MKAHLCAMPGCFLPVPERGGYCAAHAHKAAERDKARADSAARRWEKHHETHPEWSAIYRTARWRALRAAHLKGQPECVRCGEKGTTVDHVEPHRGREDLAFSEVNLMTLCERCHAIKSRLDRERE